MAVYLHVETLDGRAHPAWECGKYSGDRDVVGLIGEACGTVQHPPPERFDPWRDDTLHYRPADLAALDRVRWPAVNEERWAQLRRILREEPDYWLRLD